MKALLLLAAWLQSGSAAPPIPVRVMNNHGLVQVKLGGSRALTMVFDTGAAYTVMADHTAKELGLPKLQEFQLATTSAGKPVMAAMVSMKGLHFGNKTFAAGSAVAMDLSNLERAEGTPIDGVLGMDFLAPYMVELDYQHGNIFMQDSKTFAYHGSGLRIPFRQDRGYIEFEASITPAGGKTPITATFALDSGAGIGAGIIFSTPFAKDHGLPGASAPKVSEPFVKQAVWGETLMTLAGLDRLAIGPYSFSHPAAFFSTDKVAFFAMTGRAGLIGTAYIRKFRVFIDFPRKELIFEPNDEIAKPVENVYTGLSVLGDEKDYTVPVIERVLTGSPAAAAGFRKGDRIVEVDGAKAEMIALTTLLLGAPGKPLELTVERAGSRLKLMLPRKAAW